MQIGRYLLPDLNAGGLRRWAVYQPLAVFLTILLLPPLSWMEGSGDRNASRPFQASAQSSAVCGPLSQANCVIRNYPVGPIGADLLQLEQDGVNAYLAMHNLPAGDAHIIYDLGRSDLRDGVRAAMLTILLGAVNTDASKRTPHQQSLVNWLQGIAWTNEINQATIALSTFRSWQADPCHFTLDPVIQSAYGLSYDGAPYCFAQELQIVGPPVPSETYFRAYGLRKSYGAAADTFPYFGNLVTGTGVNASELASIAVGGYAVALAAVPPAAAQLASGFQAALDLFIETGSGDVAAAGGEFATLETFTAVGGETVAEIGGGIGTLVAAPVIIVLGAIAIGISAAIEIVQNQQQLDSVNNDLTAALALAKSTPPDLGAMAADASGQGFYKLQLIVDTQTVPEVGSAAALPLHQNGIDADFILPHTGFSHTLSYLDWNKNTWTAQTSGGWFVQTCVNGPDQTNPCGQTDSISGDIHYLDGNGVQWTASREGYNFVLTKAHPNFASDTPDVGCPANLLDGVTPTPVPSDCWSYVADNIPSLKFADGTVGPVSLSPYTLPGFNSPTTLSFAPGIASTQIVTAAGNPVPSICYSSGTLPSNFTLNGGSCGAGGSFQIKFDGGLSAPTGVYSLTLNAIGGQQVSQQFSINVATELAVVSPSTINGFAGFPLNFQVSATGNPTPTLKLDPNFAAIAPGLTLTDHHDGTGTISGSYSGVPGSNIQCFNRDPVTGNSTPCGIIATNTQGGVQKSAEQATTLNMTAAPSAIISGCNSAGVCSTGATFIAGVQNQTLLTATGAITPVSWNFFNGQSPASWLQLKDNGDGTALLSGKPPLGTTGTLTASIVAQSFGSFGLADNYPVTVLNTPEFTTSNTASFTVGSFGTVPISANMGTISAGATLPSGLSFFQGSTLSCLFCLASISGTPAAGTGGQYAVTLTDDAGTAGTATQYLTVNVNEAPAFSSPNLAVLVAGQPANFNVTTTGFPNVGTHPVAASAGPPANPSDGTGPYFTVSGLPASLQASNFSGVGLRSGTLTITGTPSASDVATRKVQITVQNGVGAPVQQSLTLQIIPSNPSASVSLLSTWTLSRDASNNVIATVVIPNNGSQGAQNVTITSAKIGSVSGAVAPTQVASIPAGSSATFRIQFPGASLGATGSSNVLSLSGTYAGGTFNNAGRIVLP